MIDRYTDYVIYKNKCIVIDNLTREAHAVFKYEEEAKAWIAANGQQSSIMFKPGVKMNKLMLIKADEIGGFLEHASDGYYDWHDLNKVELEYAYDYVCRKLKGTEIVKCHDQCEKDGTMWMLEI